jgi:hypothetical protein
MKKRLFVILALTTISATAGDVYVPPHIRSDGTFVQGHHRSSPDGSQYNNYSAQGNVNPYTGQQGAVTPYAAQPAPQVPAAGGYINGQRCYTDSYGYRHCN